MNDSRAGSGAGLTRRQHLMGGLAIWAGLGFGGPASAARRSTEAGFAPMLAQDWQPGADPAGWLVSEKFDGVRALWDGQRLRFRSGREIAAPGWFIQRLPATPLDGELWLARGQFEALSGIVRSATPDDAAWRRLAFQVFERPGAGGTFEARAAQLAREVAATGWAALQAVPQQRVADAPALQRRLDQVVAAGGEGLMLHQALAPEVSGRTPLLRKFKPLQDAEAIVVGHLPGRGRLAGRLGALQVESDDGRRFQVGTGLDDALRVRPPALGTRITYTHQGVTGSGLPRFASFLRVAPAF